MNILKKIVRYGLLKIKWSKKVKFGFNTNISLSSTFEGMNQIHPNSAFSGILGYGSYIGSYCSLDAKIGRFSSIAPLVRCNKGRHPYKYPFVSTAPCFYSLNPYKAQNGSTFATEQCYDELAYADEERQFAVIIGNDCWIGEGVFISGGVNIADGAVVLAHAVVTKDIPPYAIVGGIPAKIIGYRYSSEDIEILLKSQWWMKPPEWFKDNWRLLTDIGRFKESYSGNI